MRSALYWDVMRCMVVIPYDVSGQPISPIFKSQEIQEVFLVSLGFLDP